MKAFIIDLGAVSSKLAQKLLKVRIIVLVSKYIIEFSKTLIIRYSQTLIIQKLPNCSKNGFAIINDMF